MAKKSKALKALVTGAAGFVGSNLAIALEKSGHDVIALDDFSVGHFENLNPFTQDVIAGNVGQPGEWDAAVGPVDIVFHQAAITDTTINDQRKMLSVNVEAFRALLCWAAKRKVKKVVYASSAGVYGDLPVPMRETAVPRPLNIYAFSKKVMEATARRFAKSHPAIEVVGLRYFNVFGPGEKHKGKSASMIWQLSEQMRLGQRPRIFEFGEQYRDFIYVDDVVRANILAAQKGVRGVFNVCTGRKTNFNEIIGYLNNALGTQLQPDFIKNPYSFYQNETLGDPALAARTFKFMAEYSSERGVRKYLGQASAVGAA